MTTPDLNDLSWRRQDANGSFLVSTQPSLLDIDFIDGAFATEEMYWAKPMSRDHIKTMIANSVSFGLYDSPTSAEPSSTIEDRQPTESKKQIGFARLISDLVTTAYLTDVYILPEYREFGLGKWILACCNEAIDLHPYLRRAVLMASPGVGKKFYSEYGFWDVQEESASRIMMTRNTFGRV